MRLSIDIRSILFNSPGYTIFYSSFVISSSFEMRCECVLCVRYTLIFLSTGITLCCIECFLSYSVRPFHPIICHNVRCLYFLLAIFVLENVQFFSTMSIDRTIIHDTKSVKSMSSFEHARRTHKEESPCANGFCVAVETENWDETRNLCNMVGSDYNRFVSCFEASPILFKMWSSRSL